MPLVTLVQQSSTGTTSLANTFPDPINKLGNKWVRGINYPHITNRRPTGGIVSQGAATTAYDVGTPSQRVSMTGVQGFQNGNCIVVLHSNRTDPSDDSYYGSGYQFYLNSTGNPGIFRVVNGVSSGVASITTAGTWWTNTLTSVVLDCTIPGTVTASITYGGNTYSTSYSDPYPLQGNWASYQMWDNGSGLPQTATSLVIETLSVATVPLSIGTRSSSTVTVSTQESIAVDGHSYAYRVALTATSTVTNVGDKLVTGANSYVITAVTGTTLTVVGDPFSTTAAPGTGAATTLRSFSTINAWSLAAPSLKNKDWIWKGVLFKEGSGTNGQWNITSTPTTSTSVTVLTDAARYFWLTAAPGQSFKDTLSQSSGNAFSFYNNANGVSVFMNGNYVFLFDFYFNIKFSGLQIYKIASGQFIATGPVTYDSCIVKAISAPLHGYSIVKNSLFEISSDGAVYDGYAGSLSEPSIDPSSQLVNCTFVSTNRKGYAITMPGYGGNSMIVRNCAFFGFNTITNNVSIIRQGVSTNNATNLSTLGWTSTGTVLNLTTSSQFNNTASGAEDFRVREYSSLINNGRRDQQYTGDVDIIGRPRSTTAPTIGAWEYLSNRLVTGIQSRNQYGAVVDMGSYYVSKDYGLDVYPNLVPGRTSPGLYAWGKGDSYGGLGLGNTVNYSSPMQVGSLTNWRQIGVGGYSEQTAAIKTDGTLWMWGYNGGGQLGDGTTTNRSSPVQVSSSIPWKYVSTGIERTAAIKTDGSLWTWGYQFSGALGVGIDYPVAFSSPIQVGSATNWRQVDATTRYHTAGIQTDGTLWVWGNNSYVGSASSIPTQVGLLNNWKQVVTNYYHIAAVKTDGTLWTWGDVVYGQLGLGNNVSYNSPVQVGSLNNWRQVSSGVWHMLAVKTDGTLWAWGGNGSGTLGIGNTINYSSPVQVGSLTSWKSVFCGAFSSGAIKTDGTLWVWGSNANGQLGIGNTVNYSSPVQVGSMTSWKSAAAGYYHTIAISDGQI